VLVTGAARRLGRAIAIELARSGRDIALHFRSAGAECEATAAYVRALGVRAECFAADLADEAACRGLLPAVVARLGRIDAVVNNASHFEYDDAAQFSYASMEAHWRANTAPAIVLAQALAAHLRKRRAAPSFRAPPRGGGRLEETALGADDGCAEVGCVVNLLDQKLWNPNPDYLSYTLSKAALEAATTLLAQALAPQVRVAGVAPGVTLVSGPAMSAEGFAAAHAMTPLGRSSTPDDIARAVRFIIESPAITGTTILVDGGQHLAAQPRDVAFLTPTN